jgi:hypothetical protein
MEVRSVGAKKLVTKEQAQAAEVTRLNDALIEIAKDARAGLASRSEAKYALMLLHIERTALATLADES